MKAKALFVFLALMAIILNGCVKDERFQGPPAITQVSFTPQTPITGQEVTVSARVTDMNGVKSVTLYYQAGGQGSFQVVTMGTSATNIYTGKIPGQASGVTVLFYIQAENIYDKKTIHPATAPQTLASFTVGAPLIVMNEIYSRGVVAEPDWIEIYNGSDIAVNITGYKIYDIGGQGGAKPKMLFPTGSIIPPKGFLVIVVDIGTTIDPASFGLSSGGEEVWLENANGNLIDNIFFPAMDVTQTYGRFPDGTNNWKLLNTITKGTSNRE